MNIAAYIMLQYTGNPFSIDNNKDQRNSNKPLLELRYQEFSQMYLLYS